jgi:hypothetical protein
LLSEDSINRHKSTNNFEENFNILGYDYLDKITKNIKNFDNFNNSKIGIIVNNKSKEDLKANNSVLKLIDNYNLKV